MFGLSPQELAAIITAVGAIIISLAGTYLQWKKFRVTDEPMAVASSANAITDVSAKVLISIRTQMEKDRTDYQTKLDDARKEYKAEIDDVRNDVKSAREETDAVRAEYRAKEITKDEEIKMLYARLDELEDVRDWAERLAHQVISYGGTPVKIRERKVK